MNVLVLNLVHEKFLLKFYIFIVPFILVTNNARIVFQILYLRWFSCTPVQCTLVLLYACTPVLLYSCTPVLLYSCTPVLLHSCTPVLLYSCTSVLLYSCNLVILYSCTPVLLYSWPIVHVDKDNDIYKNRLTFDLHTNVCSTLYILHRKGLNALTNCPWIKNPNDKIFLFSFNV